VYETHSQYTFVRFPAADNKIGNPAMLMAFVVVHVSREDHNPGAKPLPSCANSNCFHSGVFGKRRAGLFEASENCLQQCKV